MKPIPIFVLACALTTLAQVSHPPRETAAHPRWALHWSSGKGNFWIDQPDCHPLEYFSKAPKRFDYGQDLFAVSPADIKDRAEETHIGEAQGFAIHQVMHTIHMEGWDLFIKMVLVERKKGEFCEIYNAEYDSRMASIDPAYIVNLDSQEVLATHDRVAGTGNSYVEEYWTFDKQGPEPLDRSVIGETLKKLLPEGDQVLKGGGFDIEKLCYAMPVWRGGDANCCPSAGKVQIKFALEDHRLVVVKQKYNPDPAMDDDPMACTL